ncbi:MAG: DNA polymerase III subunit alpha, partial [Hyphomicrobiales bacterium]|nr:DNA polymerase III subunit alpha [Hyphomicrobiales bacterium]
GLVKFDFLGLKTLTVLDKAVKLVAKRDIDIELSNLPLDDTKTFEMLSRAETIGVFQLESSGMRDLTRKSQPANIEDIIAIVALYRPGPMENIPKYIASKKGEEQPEFLHELVTPITADTYGVIIYQEQVLQIAQVLAGYSLGEADILRKAMGKKIKAEMDQQRERFVTGAVEKGVDKKQASFIFDLVAKFAGYGFNKAHSACYALLAYQTAYLKAHYPVELIAASMTLDLRNTDKLQVFRREAQRMSIGIVPPDINQSGTEFEVHDGKIVYALSALKNVGRAAVEHIVACRDEEGPFTSLGNFARRIDPRAVNKRALESMAKAGAFDCLSPNRAQVLAGVETIIGLANRTSAEAATGQDSLFGNDEAGQADELPLAIVEAWLPMDRLGHEFDAIGFYLSGHPLDDYEDSLRKLGVENWLTFQQKAITKGATAAKLAGTVTYRQERRSKSGNRFAFIGFSDPSGQFESICFSELLAHARDELEPGRALILRVEADVEAEEVRLRLAGVEPLDKATANIATGLEIFVQDASPVDSISKRLTNGGKARVNLILQPADAPEVKIALGNKFTVTPQIKAAIKAIDGVRDVQDL